MRKYELTVVLGKKATETKKKSIAEKINGIVGGLKGKVEKPLDWGEKEIGIFLHFPLELEASSAKPFEAKLRAEGEIERFMLIRKED